MLLFPGTKVETILSWACSAKCQVLKNSLSTIAGFSSNQLMFGTQTYLPNALNSNPPALENETRSQVVATHINLMNASRKMYLNAESSERVMKALKKPLRTYSVPIVLGSKVYYKVVGTEKWKGPATVIGQNSAVVFLRQRSFVIRIHHSRVMPVKEQHLSEDQTVGTSVTIENTEPVPRESLLGIPQYLVGDSVPSTDPGVIDDCQEEDYIDPVKDVSLIENWNNSFLDEHSADVPEVSEVAVEVPDSQPANTVQENERSQKKPTVIKRGSTLIFVDDGEQYGAVVLSRAGKATGKKKN